MNIWLIFDQEYNLLENRIKFSSLNLLILTIHSYFMHLLNENQYISIQICCSLFCIVLNRCFVIKESNPDLVPLLSYHVKYLVISHISQLWHMITFERSRSGISHIRQSSCYPMSSMTFINLSIFIWRFHKPRKSFRPLTLSTHDSLQKKHIHLMTFYV